MGCRAAGRFEGLVARRGQRDVPLGKVNFVISREDNRVGRSLPLHCLARRVRIDVHDGRRLRRLRPATTFCSSSLLKYREVIESYGFDDFMGLGDLIDGPAGGYVYDNFAT